MFHVRNDHISDASPNNRPGSLPYGPWILSTVVDSRRLPSLPTCQLLVLVVHCLYPPINQVFLGPFLCPTLVLQEWNFFLLLVVCSVQSYFPLVQKTLRSEWNPEPLHRLTALDQCRLLICMVLLPGGITVFCSQLATDQSSSLSGNYSNHATASFWVEF